MAGERINPILPCADLEEALVFHQALGFSVTFRQLRPNPCAVVELEDIAIHLAAIDGFDPSGSYGSAIITVPDPERTHAAFKAGLRERFGKVPIKGIPRLLPPRRKAGTATGFTVVDAGGNWLRFYRTAARARSRTNGGPGWAGRLMWPHDKVMRAVTRHRRSRSSTQG